MKDIIDNVIHAASPLPLPGKNSRPDIIDPTIKSTANIFDAAHEVATRHPRMSEVKEPTANISKAYCAARISVLLKLLGGVEAGYMEHDDCGLAQWDAAH
ncbi:hypothetical protein ACMFMF_010020 [Clarireedia jacksonii]